MQKWQNAFSVKDFILISFKRSFQILVLQNRSISSIEMTAGVWKRTCSRLSWMDLVGGPCPDRLPSWEPGLTCSPSWLTALGNGTGTMHTHAHYMSLTTFDAQLSLVYSELIYPETLQFGRVSWGIKKKSMWLCTVKPEICVYNWLNLMPY